MDFPNIRHMRVFRAAVETGSVSDAAERCHLSQPAASQGIAGLERALGAPLLIRTGRRLQPTEAGALFARRSGRALDHLARAARAAMRMGDTGRAAGVGFDRTVTAAQLRTLIAISATGSFTLAARTLGVAQPTVHRAARGLEALAGCAFFRATAVGVELTGAAQAFAHGAKLAQTEIRQGVEEIGRLLGEDRGTFTLGSLPLARTFIVPGAVDAMVSATTGVQIRVVEGRYPQLLRGLREGDLDCLIGALRDPAPAEDVTQQCLFEDELVLVAHPDHPLVRAEAATLDDTLAYPWVAPPKDTPAGSYLFETLRIHERDQTPVRVVSSSLAFLRGILARGPYVSIISRHQIQVEAEDGRIAELPIRLDGQFRKIGLTFRTGWRPTATQAQFIEYLCDFARHPTQTCAGKSRPE